MSGAKPIALPDALPGEDRGYGGALCVDLVPRSAWGQSVRSVLSKHRWQRLSRGIRRRAEGSCEACGMVSSDTMLADLACHERWQWDEQAGVQRLARLMSLCQACDAVTHLGYYRTQHDGDDGVPRAHLARIRGWSAQEVAAHIEEAESSWDRRSQIDWQLDIEILRPTGLLPVGGVSR